MKSVNKIIFPTGNYLGYYWMSDTTDPVIVNGNLPEIISSLNPAENPFVIEANLFNQDDRMSYTIKFIDGNYVLTSCQIREKLVDVESGIYDNITLKEYYANRMPGLILLFFQYWREQPDPLCAEMPVLHPAEMAFVGFKPTK